MFCPVCGNQLPDGSVACNVCGAQLSQYTQPAQQPQYDAQPQQPQYEAPQQPQYDAQPQQPQYSAPQQPQYSAPQQPQYNPQAAQPQYNAQPQQPQYGAPQQPQYNPQAPQQPQQFGQMPAARPAGTGAPVDFTTLVNSIKTDKLSLLTIGGAALLFLSAIIPAWATLKMFGMSESYSIWSIGGIYVISAILFLLAPIAIVAFRFKVLNIPVLDKFKQLPYSSCYIPGVLFLLFLIMTIDMASATGDYGGLASFKFGFSWYLALLGLGGIIAEVVMKIVKKEEYYL